MTLAPLANKESWAISRRSEAVLAAQAAGVTILAFYPEAGSKPPKADEMLGESPAGSRCGKP